MNAESRQSIDTIFPHYPIRFAAMKQMRLGRFVQINRSPDNCCFMLSVAIAAQFLPCCIESSDWWLLHSCLLRYRGRQITSLSILNIRVATQAHISIYHRWINIIWQYTLIRTSRYSAVRRVEISRDVGLWTNDGLVNEKNKHGSLFSWHEMYLYRFSLTIHVETNICNKVCEWV